MTNTNSINIKAIVDGLCDEKFDFLMHSAKTHIAMPSVEKLELLVNKLKSVIFPGYHGNSDISNNALPYYLGSAIEDINKLLREQIHCGLCFNCGFDELTCSNCEASANKIANEFLEKLPKIKAILSTDVIAAYNGDPAAKNYGETIFCYPSLNVLTHHRIAHELLKLGVPLIPRIIAEMAHSKTGIDIHPGATIGKYFFIDHGTGVVIGETSIIGKNVRIYQGVTLGAKSFPLDENGKPIKGIARHPIVEDDVTIYSNSTILGRITIGKGAVVGGNMWVTDSVAPNAKIYK
ncbi:MAG: serine O-acetyltransferase EpsC [Bacteroidota bacterium]